MNLPRYWHTLRHLKRQQFTGRLAFRLRRPTPDLRPAPPVRPASRPWTGPDWRPSALTGDATLTFLNLPAAITPSSIWQDTSRGRLWLYNLHYFDDLTAEGAAHRRPWHQGLVTRWIDENPPGAGAGWEPYPTSFRLVNWIKWSLAAGSEGPTDAQMYRSLAVQTRWLSQRLEFHILGNHLWANAKALLMAGLFFDGPEAAAWRERGLAIVSAQLTEQVLADGGHFERSPMYHAIVLEDILDLLQASGTFPGVMPPVVIDQLQATASRMLRWLRVMTHPDGDIAFFNDAACGIAAPHAALDAYARTQGVAVDDAPLGRVEWLRESGYVRLSGARAVVWCDVAPVGPDYQPGHAHADTLSFELSIDGRRVVVNGGTSTYDPGPERSRQRGTRAHSTVEVDGRNSSDVWGGFRVGRRARPGDVRVTESDSDISVEASHDGYRHRGGVIHHRAWRLSGEQLIVIDSLSGRWQQAVARFLLHPDAARDTPRIVSFSSSSPSPIVEQDATWHPAFGRTIKTRAVDVPLVEPRTSTTLTWS